MVVHYDYGYLLLLQMRQEVSPAQRLGNGSDAAGVPSERSTGCRWKAGLSSGRCLGGAGAAFSSHEV